MKSLHILLLITFVSNITLAQQIMVPESNSEDYYYQIPSYPDRYTAESVTARLIDGLAFRFYWATEGLTQKDLDYLPGNNGKSVSETLDHIFGMSYGILNAIHSQPNTRIDGSGMNDNEKRQKTLENLRNASELLIASKPGEMENMKVIFGSSEFPFWNMINGQISDCIYHTGQIVSFRRSSGNPVDPNISVFQGQKRK